MQQSQMNESTILQYKEVVEKYQQYLEERAKIRHRSNDKLSMAVKKIYLNPLLPSLQNDPEPSQRKLSKRKSSIFKDQYSHFKEKSIDSISNNIQQSIVSKRYNSVQRTNVVQNKMASNQNHESVKTTLQQHQMQQQPSFFIGFYKNQRAENLCKNVTVKELVDHKHLQEVSSIHLPQLQQLSYAANEINLNKYFIKKERLQKAQDEIQFTNRWDRERGSNAIRIDNLSVEQLSQEVLNYLLSQDLMRIYFSNSNQIKLQTNLTELLAGVFYEKTLNFQHVITYFQNLNLQYLEFFSIKYALAQVLINHGLNFLLIERALNQLEEYRYLLQKPIAFISQLFENKKYQNVAKSIIIKLLKNNVYQKFLQLNKFESENFISGIRNGLFPYLVGDYVALPKHCRINDVKAENFSPQILQPYINDNFISQIKNFFIEQNLDELYIKDVERRLVFPQPEKGIPYQGNINTNFAFYFISSYVQCRNTLIPSYDIKALLKLIRINESENDSTIYVDNMRYLAKFDYIKEQINEF